MVINVYLSEQDIRELRRLWLGVKLLGVLVVGMLLYGCWEVVRIKLAQ